MSFITGTLCPSRWSSPNKKCLIAELPSTNEEIKMLPELLHENTTDVSTVVEEYKKRKGEMPPKTALILHPLNIVWNNLRDRTVFTPWPQQSICLRTINSHFWTSKYSPEEHRLEHYRICAGHRHGSIYGVAGRGYFPITDGRNGLKHVEYGMLHDQRRYQARISITAFRHEIERHRPIHPDNFPSKPVCDDPQQVIGSSESKIRSSALWSPHSPTFTCGPFVKKVSDIVHRRSFGPYTKEENDLITSAGVKNDVAILK